MKLLTLIALLGLTAAQSYNAAANATISATGGLGAEGPSKPASAPAKPYNNPAYAKPDTLA